MPTATASTTAPSVDRLVDLTPAHRDRTVDAVRGLCIVVVVLWHWVFSITHVTASGRLSMPNPIGDVRFAWLATWVLQVMPAFFVVGGFANLASWEGHERDGGTARGFVAGRLARLGRPVATMALVWAVIDMAGQVGFGAPSVLRWGLVVFVPLWFLGAYGAVIAVAPWTIRAHRSRPGPTFAGLLAVVAGADALRFATGDHRWGLVTTAAVWVGAHQLGYLWRDGTIARWGRRGPVLLAAGGGLALVLLTQAGPYPASMVAVRGEALGNMFPTTAAVAALAVTQLGLILLVRPRLERLLARRSAWKAVVVVNATAMTVFCWHMTALVVVIGAVRAVGFELPAHPDATWWVLRPVWLVLPGVVLLGLVKAFVRFERPSRR
ncbi:MAG: acyltransferase [Acidimicrobiales bacterium]|nr:acyltransferase [Acidimicrobiales bacterium]